MKILELTTFSAGGCGVWARVRREAALLTERKHDVHVYSSDFIKGSNARAPAHGQEGNVSIRRFPGVKLGGESFMVWNFESAALRYKPDVIIAHAYRHTHTTKALSIAKKLKIPVFLVTHAPFNRGSTRSFFAKVAVFVYDICIGRRTLSQFTKVIAITQWEIPYLKKLGLKESTFVYLPNGLSEQFFTPLKKRGTGIIYTGRIAPIKNLETVSRALCYVTQKNKPRASVLFLGPVEEGYLSEIQKRINRDRVEINIKNHIYGPQEQIKELDKHEIFILPSLSEGMPQAAIEAMARGKIVIASNNEGNADIIQHGKNGFLFPIGDEKALAELINKTISLSAKEKSKIIKGARATAETYRWKTLGKKFVSLVTEDKR